MIESEMNRLLDEREIVSLAVRYCWALDERDWEALASIFITEATAQLGAPGIRQGREEIVEMCRLALTPLDASHHLVSNHQVSVFQDMAVHRCYLQAQHVRKDVPKGSPNYMVAGRYEDQLVRTAEGWRIKHRDLIVTWTEGNREAVRARR